jgi:hypothetical protein
MSLFAGQSAAAGRLKTERTGTFVDNMVLPVHRWFRYSAGFAAEWARTVLDKWGLADNAVVLDPFAGSGTIALVSDVRRNPSVNVEAHPFVARICKAKLLWRTPVNSFLSRADAVFQGSRSVVHNGFKAPALLQATYDENTLRELIALKESWRQLDDGSPESELAWLALSAILRPTSCAGTAPWQYILPRKRKKHVVPAHAAYHRQVETMAADMHWMQDVAVESRADVMVGDARNLSRLISVGIDAVITSPPYANNYDYADALRFEMTFWDEVAGWGDIHEKVRRRLIVSCSQHASRERLNLADLLQCEGVSPIRSELTAVTEALAKVRMQHGGRKHYHTMVAAYCRDVSVVLRQLRTVCRHGAHMCWVVGDSAPYGVHCPIERWTGEMALAAGFHSYHYEKLRDRNTKWKNRKHRVPLTEGLLWVEG